MKWKHTFSFMKNISKDQSQFAIDQMPIHNQWNRFSTWQRPRPSFWTMSDGKQKSHKRTIVWYNSRLQCQYLLYLLLHRHRRMKWHLIRWYAAPAIYVLIDKLFFSANVLKRNKTLPAIAKWVWFIELNSCVHKYYVGMYIDYIL